MPKLKTYIFVIIIFITSLSAFELCAQTVSSTELINNAKSYDGKTVGFTGEVIGDVMARGDFAWINVNDGYNAVGIWIEKKLSQEISYTGSFKTKGDKISVEGVFQRACPEHGGDFDIHAVALKKISSGRQTAEGLNISKRNFALILFGVLCLIIILSRLKRTSLKK